MELETTCCLESQKSVYLEKLNLEYRVLSSRIIHIKRELLPLENYNIVDAFGSCWVFLFLRVSNGKIRTRLGNADFTQLPSGALCGFIPSYSIVEWEFTKGHYEVEMLAFVDAPPCDLSDFPIAWSCEHRGNIGDHLNSFLENSNILKSINIDRSKGACSLSIKVKEYIIKKHGRSVSLSSLAKSLKTSPAVMSRYFKKSYGISPIQYLNLLRVIESLRVLLLEDLSIENTSAEVGFGQSRQFYQHFNSVMQTAPSLFL